MLSAAPMRSEWGFLKNLINAIQNTSVSKTLITRTHELRWKEQITPSETVQGFELHLSLRVC